MREYCLDDCPVCESFNTSSKSSYTDRLCDCYECGFQWVIEAGLFDCDKGCGCTKDRVEYYREGKNNFYCECTACDSKFVVTVECRL